MLLKSKQRHFLTLIEVLIAIGLVAVLLTTLLGIYSYVDKMHKEIRLAEQTNFRLLYVQFRLAEVLPNAIKKEKKADQKEADDFYFYTTTTQFKKTSASLVFTFDNGISTPEFSNHVIGRLYIDAENRLCLATWPSISRNSSPSPPMRKEVLLEGVEDIFFAFYIAPKEEGKIIDPEAAKRYGVWHAEWPVEGVKPEEVSLPPLMRLYVRLVGSKKEKNMPDLSFAFMLPNSEQHIVYYQ